MGHKSYDHISSKSSPLGIEQLQILNDYKLDYEENYHYTPIEISHIFPHIF